jgi:hypothetical protein
VTIGQDYSTRLSTVQRKKPERSLIWTRPDGVRDAVAKAHQLLLLCLTSRPRSFETTIGGLYSPYTESVKISLKAHKKHSTGGV